MKRNWLMVSFLGGLSGCLYFLCFPKFSLGSILGWGCLGPLFWAIRHSSGNRQALVSGFFCGWVGYLGILYWIPVTIRMGGGNDLLAMTAWILSGSILAVFFGIFALVVRFVPRHWSSIGQALTVASLWVFFESARASSWAFLGGFPWCLLGHALVEFSWFLQLAELGGVAFLGFILVFAQWGMVNALEKKNWKEIFVMMAIVLILGGLGGLRKRQLSQQLIEGPSVAIAQGNIYQFDKWSEEKYQSILSTYRNLTAQAAQMGAQYLIYPESSYPELLDYDSQDTVSDEGLSRLVRDLGPFGSIKTMVGVVMTDSMSLYNSALMISQGEVSGLDHKQHLVPFGEYFPWAVVLMPVLRWIHGGVENPPVLNAVGNFAAAKRKNLLPDKIGVTICYESIFPDIFRDLRRQGAQWLVNMTNDGWYLDTAAPYQHFMMNIPRAVENRLPLARAANTGISAIIDPLGRVTAASNLNETRLLTGRLLLMKSPVSGLWPWLQWVFPWVCCLMVLFFTIVKILNESFNFKV